MARHLPGIVTTSVGKVLSPLAQMALGLALAGGLLVIGLRITVDERDVTVFALGGKAASGHSITPAEIQTVKRDRRSANGRIRSRAAIAGHVTTREIGAGEVLRPGDVAAAPLPAGAGHRAFALAITPDVTLSEPFRTGDRVDLAFAATKQHQGVLVGNVAVVEVRSSPSTMVVALDGPQTDAVLDVLASARLVVTRTL